MRGAKTLSEKLSRRVETPVSQCSFWALALRTAIPWTAVSMLEAYGWGTLLEGRQLPLYSNRQQIQHPGVPASKHRR